MTDTIVDYSRLQSDLEEYAALRDFYLGIGFVDLQTGDTVSIDGGSRYYALSTFKGPLAVYYLYLLERGLIEEDPGAEEQIQLMLAWSSNPATTCVFKRVGGIAPFNDWLAEQGFRRDFNFVFVWQSWPCNESGGSYVPPGDFRYRNGDAALGLPGNKALLRCPDESVPCDKSFAPLELARFYSRVYQGQVISPASTERWLAWMEKGRDISYFMDDLAVGVDVTVYSKNGFRQADTEYTMNFYHEAGIMVTERGAFALAIFTQGNSDWPGGWAIADVAGIVYYHFMREHLGDPNAP